MISLYRAIPPYTLDNRQKQFRVFFLLRLGTSITLLGRSKLARLPLFNIAPCLHSPTVPSPLSIQAPMPCFQAMSFRHDRRPATTVADNRPTPGVPSTVSNAGIMPAWSRFHSPTLVAADLR